MPSMKASPFVLSDSRLNNLAGASQGDPAVLDLVRVYLDSVANMSELREILDTELAFFGV